MEIGAERGRVYGPYLHRNRWHVVVIDDAGRRSVQICGTHHKAAELIRRLDAELSDGSRLRIATALGRYSNYLEHKGNRATSIATTVFRLRALFGDELIRPLRRLDAETCQRLYDDLVDRTAVDTHRSTLAEAKTFLRWCIRRRFIALNPADAVLPVGRRRYGKPQLRVNEA